MSTDLITSDNLSLEGLKAIFDDAFMETNLEDEDLLYVRDGNLGCYVMPSESKGDIRLVGYASAKENTKELQKLQFANRANLTYKFVRTYILQNGRFAFDYFVMINDGLTRRNLVQTFKRFINIPIDILNECDEDGIFG